MVAAGPGDEAGSCPGGLSWEALRSVFGLRFLPPSREQSEAGIASLLGVFRSFLAALKDSSSAVWPSLLPADLKALTAACAAATDAQAVTWFPQFGAALLALGSGPYCIGPRPGTLALHLVCLDAWRSCTHSTPSGASSSAESAAYELEPCGTVPAAELGRLLQDVRKRMGQAEEQRAKGVKGFQRTPGFILSVVDTAVVALQSPEQGGSGSSQGVADAGAGGRTARGRYTDVGLHTNTEVPDTCWPLVRSVLHALLEHSPGCNPVSPPALLFERALAHLELWLLQGIVRNLGQQAWQLLPLTASGATMPQPLEGGSRRQATLPRGTLPAGFQPAQEEGGIAAARQRATRNLGSVPLLPRGSSFTAILSHLRDKPQWRGPTGDVQYQLVLRSVERELFSRAAAGFDKAAAALSEAEVAALEAVVDTYRMKLQRFLATPAAAAAAAAGGVLRAELLSRELLVVWVAYCLVHSAAGRQYSTLRQYGVALSYKDLRHLVLSDKAAVDAALAVAAYLRRWTSPGKELFSLRDEGAATFDLARALVPKLSRLTKLLAEEQERAAARRAQHWEEVQRKQKEAQRLREELRRLETEGASLKLRRDELRSAEAQRGRAVKSRTSGWTLNSPELSKAEQDVTQNSAFQKRTEAQLQETLKAPLAVIQPLPADPDRARVWIFFLHMPTLLRSLARTSFLAQQVLLPRPLSAKILSAVTVGGLQTSLASHYNSHRRTAPEGSEGAVKLRSPDLPPAARDVGPRSVDECQSPSDGVWHPDTLKPRMAWCGSGAEADIGLGASGCFNPFAPVPASAVELFYTATLPAEAAALQRALHTPESPSAERGNWALARQDLRPDWLSKPGFLDFASLRAFPLRQLWRLCVALRERTLPLGHPAVHVLVRQLLYHIGTLSDDEAPQPLRRAGWDEAPNGVLHTLGGGGGEGGSGGEGGAAAGGSGVGEGAAGASRQEGGGESAAGSSGEGGGSSTSAGPSAAAPESSEAAGPSASTNRTTDAPAAASSDSAGPGPSPSAPCDGDGAGPGPSSSQSSAADPLAWREPLLARLRVRSWLPLAPLLLQWAHGSPSRRVALILLACADWLAKHPIEGGPDGAQWARAAAHMLRAARQAQVLDPGMGMVVSGALLAAGPGGDRDWQPQMHAVMDYFARAGNASMVPLLWCVELPEAEVAAWLPRSCGLGEACVSLAGDGEAGVRLQACAGCRAVHYCSRECQRAAWLAGHKEECAGAAAAAAKRRAEG
ncbi:hypothetical protein HYH03_013157 [Edaphochlamys debaryana]|uniref:MYND-type domain-containing protein n=1 Tax=Edaphochlamys debaryana TaxID=47281 RepID=A0A836BTP9_9CHLO|nr:hypothetical protein HYH03_013157 [Edaphochlamys debaryana]|eukprot:KAG2488307.1 hypothetical protein HYH03_013157 [Edaphochlamys debaryana]